jgi:hypothetical protein
MTWQAAVAIYGAGLSSFLALSRLDAPIATLEPVRGSSDAVEIQIFNPSRRALFVRVGRQIRRAGPNADYKINHRRTLDEEQAAREFDLSQQDRQYHPEVYVPPSATVRLLVNGITNDADRVIVLRWHRNWWPLWFIEMPSFTRIAADQIRQMNLQ